MKAKQLLTGTLLVLISALCYSQDIHSGIIYNLQGPEKGAWNLLNHTALSSRQSNEEKDLVNTTQITDPQPFFRHEWISYNSTLYVKDATLRFDNVRYDSLKAHFNASSNPNQLVNNVSVGDVYIAKIRKSETFAIIQIVELADDGCSLLCDGKNNLDYIKFDYKLVIKPVLAALEPAPSLSKETKKILSEEKVLLSIYPNPLSTNSILEISPIQTHACAVTIYDIAGNVVHIDQLPALESKLTISKNQLSIGLYIVVVQNNRTILGKLRLKVE